MWHEKSFAQPLGASFPKSTTTVPPAYVPTSTAESVRQKLDTAANMLSSAMQQNPQMQGARVEDKVSSGIDRKAVSEEIKSP